MVDILILEVSLIVQVQIVYMDLFFKKIWIIQVSIIGMNL